MPKPFPQHFLLSLIVDRINTSIKNSTWLIVLAAVAFSFVFPQVGIIIKPQMNYLLICLMFLSCLDLKIEEIVKSLSDVKNISLMLLIVHLVSPLIVYLLRSYFSNEIFLGLIIVATIPAGRSAVFLSKIYGGVPLKSLVSTSISNFFSPISVPLFVWIFAHATIKINPVQMSQTIVFLVVIPLLLAIFVGKSRFGKKLNIYSPSLSVILLFFIILGLVSPLKSIVTDNLSLFFGLSLFSTILIVINFCLGYLLGNNHADNITYAISCSYKNYALATLLSLTIFNPIVALPAIAYTVVSNLLLIPLQIFLQPPKPNPHHRHRKHNLRLLFIGAILAIILVKSNQAVNFSSTINSYPVLFAYLSGILFASTFTVTTGALILISLSQTNPIIIISILATLGAITCDSFIFLAIKDKVADHISETYSYFSRHNHLHKILHTRYFAWTLPVIGAILMATPLPDEIAVSLLGLSKLSYSKFIAIALVSHFLGISLILTSFKVI
jgi:predicted Na+-dependent transporter